MKWAQNSDSKTSKKELLEQISAKNPYVTFFLGHPVQNKNTKCPLDAHCHRHCRGDLRISKDFKDWIGAKTQLASGGPA